MFKKLQNKPKVEKMKPVVKLSVSKAAANVHEELEAKTSVVVPTAVAVVDGKPKKTADVQTLRGMKDVLPDDQLYWEMIRNKAEELAAAYGFKWIETPILERTELFTRPLGKESDVVQKEMYSFLDQGGDKVTLRPEGTASVARAYVNHGMWTWPQPVKIFYWGPMFRYDRPQKGRYRQFHQAGFEVLGSQLPIVDAELILIVYNLYKELGLETKVMLNSIGTPESRQDYLAQLVPYYRSNRQKLCEDCKRRLQKNPLRVLDCKEPSCVEVKNAAPQMIDWLDEDSKAHFMKVLEYLDEVEVPYTLNSHLVRGFDYYTRTVFEFWVEGAEDVAQVALCGGGRYDGLVEMLGGQPTPACGVAPGIERLVLALKEKGIPPKQVKKPQIFLAQLGEQARVKALSLFEEFRKANIQVLQTFAKEALKSQLELANKHGVPYTLILGQKEVLDGTILIRDMDGGNQENVDMKKVVGEIKKKLKALDELPAAENGEK
ncbi:MAG: histidine--tRNA ligase [bacterium]